MARSKSTTPAPTPPAAGVFIAYDRVTRDYALYLDGQLVGYAGSYREGEATLTSLRLDQAAHTPGRAA